MSRNRSEVCSSTQSARRHRAVDLVDNHDRPQAKLECVCQNERVLGGPFGRVDDQQRAIAHAQDSLDLAAKSAFRALSMIVQPQPRVRVGILSVAPAQDLLGG